MERAGNAGWLLIAAQQGRRVFSVDMYAPHIGRCAYGNLLSDKAELSTGTPSEPGPSILPMPAKGGQAMGPSQCWQSVPRGALSILKHLFFGVQICSQQLTQGATPAAAEVGVRAVPRCHETALLPSPSSTKSLLCPQPSRSQCPPPQEPQESIPGQGRGPPIMGSGRSSASPPLAQAFAPTLGQELCQGLLQQGPPALGHAAEIALEIWWWPCRPHPQFLGIISSSPLLSTDVIWPKAAQDTPEQDC